MRRPTDDRDPATSPPPRGLRAREILAFWAPLAATWLMMAVEGPYVAAIIARLRDAEINLAAYGVAFSFAFMAEAPIIMMMTAANALVKDRASLVALRRFLYLLNAGLTVAMTVAVLPPVFRFLAETAIGLPADIARLTHRAAVLLVLWPAAIGYRRFYQGILVSHHLPRRVAYGTVVRLLTMSVVAPVLAWLTALPGASVGALSLAGGVLMEAAASRWMAAGVVREIMRRPAREGQEVLPLREIARFYVPLALTSLLAVVINPLLTFFMGRSRSPIESLAVLPVVTSFVFIFRSGALAFQEVGVALIGANPENRGPVARVAVALAGVSAVGLVAVLFTPLGPIWLEDVAGLSPALARFALWPARLLALLPALDYLLVFRRSLLVLARRTRWITAATAVEATAIFVGLVVGVRGLGLAGAAAAASGMLLGRVAGNAFLVLAAGDASRETVLEPNR